MRTIKDLTIGDSPQPGVNNPNEWVRPLRFGAESFYIQERLLNNFLAALRFGPAMALAVKVDITVGTKGEQVMNGNTPVMTKNSTGQEVPLLYTTNAHVISQAFRLDRSVQDFAWIAQTSREQVQDGFVCAHQALEVAAGPKASAARVIQVDASGFEGDLEDDVPAKAVLVEQD